MSLRIRQNQAAVLLKRKDFFKSYNLIYNNDYMTPEKNIALHQ